MDSGSRTDLGNHGELGELSDLGQLGDAAAALAPDLVALRRALHQLPEIGLHLPRTQELVQQALDGLGLEITLGAHTTAVTAVLRGGRPGPVVLLRGDMDALPVTERTGEEFSSQVDGAMHACGHDLHTAGLVGAARLLAARRADLAGDVVFMFQPGEEGYDGARYMIDEGVIEAAGRPASHAYGLHVSSSMFPAGVFAGRPGAMMSASAQLAVRIVGAGGHGSMPHRTRDPVPVACEIVLGLQSLVTRRFDVFDPVVVTVGSLHAGTKRNIVPDEATFDATVRAYSDDTLAQVGEYARVLCEHTAAAHGLRAEVEFTAEYPVTVNDETEHAFVADTVREVFGADRYVTLPDPIPGSEDFSRVLERVPGAFVFLGATCGDDPQTAPTNHSAQARFDDAVLADGARLLAALTLRRLSG